MDWVSPMIDRERDGLLLRDIALRLGQTRDHICTCSPFAKEFEMVSVMDMEIIVGRLIEAVKKLELND
jgi:hypothetical protein